MRKTDTGRDRVAYWIWQGVNSSPNEKGLSALMTVFLDEEKGPHVRKGFSRSKMEFPLVVDSCYSRT